jgi:hypothetical protein
MVLVDLTLIVRCFVLVCLVECPSGDDVLKGYGAHNGRDCSGRGVCDYTDGTCSCFSGYYGTRCEFQTILG